MQPAGRPSYANGRPQKWCPTPWTSSATLPRAHLEIGASCPTVPSAAVPVPSAAVPGCLGVLGASGNVLRARVGHGHGHRVSRWARARMPLGNFEMVNHAPSLVGVFLRALRRGWFASSAPSLRRGPCAPIDPSGKCRLFEDFPRALGVRRVDGSGACNRLGGYMIRVVVVVALCLAGVCPL